MPIFIIIPLALFIAALIGITVIVWRKLPYLKKLTPEAAHERRNGWLYSMFSELVDWYKGIPFKRYNETIFQETEKFLRKIRLIFSRIDRVSASLIHRVRRVHVESSMNHVPNTPATIEHEQKQFQENLDTQTLEKEIPVRGQLKKKEQKIIMEIAKNPKDPVLYEELGDIYMKMEEYADAKESFEAALEFKPGEQGLIEKLSKVLAKLPSEPGQRKE